MIEAVDKGYTLVTHLYSGMKGVVRVNAYRVAGCIEAGLYDDRITCEVIGDGKHLPHSLLKLIYKCKGADRICLITDGIRGAGLPDGTEFVSGRKEDGVPAIIEDGVGKMMDRQAFVGSVATTDRLFKNMITLGGATIVDVAKMMSTTPARVMGYTDRGAIETGKRADLVIVDTDLEVTDVYLAGERV
jgi:N-acetylglucosamine-6-phosphate deacetylase